MEFTVTLLSGSSYGPSGWLSVEDTFGEPVLPHAYPTREEGTR
jgi:hypothetical protein